MTEVDDRGARAGLSWPAAPGVFVDTSRCPSCFTPVTSSPCTSCGLNLTDPRTARVLELSTRIVSLVDERADVVLRLHRDAAESALSSPAVAAYGPASVPVAVAPVETAWSAPAPLPEEAGGRAQPPLTPVPRPAGDGVAASVADAQLSVPPVARASAMPVPSSVPPSPPVGEPPVAEPAEPRKPRRSSVQVFLLSVGVVLLAVAAAFFLTVAWISGGLVLRSIIIGLITAVVIATASLLRRRGLGATAEGIALLGMALVGLDAWAVRANDVGGSASADANVFWGATLVGAGLAFVGWARLSRLRAPLSAAVIALATGPAVLAAGVVGRDTAAGWYVWGLVLVIVALAAPLAPRLARPRQTPLTVEIAVVRGLAALGAIAASVAALVIDPRSVATPATLSVPLAVALGVHAWSFARRGAARLAPIAAVLAVLSLGVGIAATAVRSADATLSVTVPLLVAAALALALDAAARRAPTGVGHTTLATAALAATIGAALAALAPISWALTALGAPLRAAIGVFRGPALGVDVPDAGSTASVIALVAVAVLAVVVWRMSGSWAVRRQLAWGLAAGVALLAGPQLRVVLLVVGWYLALAVIAVVVLRRRRDDVALAAVTGILALGGGWLMSFSSPLTWGLATIVVVGVLAAAAGVHPGLRVASTVGVVLFVSGSALLMPMALRIGADVIVPGTSPFIAALAAASLCLAALVVPISRRAGLDDPQRGAGAIAALGVVVAAAPLAALFRTGWAAHVWLVAALGLAAAAAAVLLAPPYRSWRVTRPIAALLFPLLTAGAAGAALGLVEATPLARVIVLAALVVLVAAAALRLLAAEHSTRLVVDAGTAIVAVVAVVTAPSGGVRWVPLLLVAVAAVLWATDADGLFTSRGPRRHLLWVALGVGTLALWTRLFWQGTDHVEPFTLPVGLAVLALAAGHERARRLVEGRSVAAPAVIAGAGMSIALLPSALVSADDPLRALVVGVASVVILLGGAALRPPRTPDALPVALATSGALALVLLTASQIANDLGRLPARLGVADLVTVVTTAALAGAAIAVSRRPVGWALPAARVAAITAMSILALAATTLVAGDGGPVVRAVGAVILLGSIGVIALRFEHRLLGLPPAGTALGGAGLVALVGVGADIRPLEGMTVPVALAWLAAALLRRPRVLTPALLGLAAAGLAVGLLPSALIADSSLVRAIGVVVAAVIVLAGAVIGARGPRGPLLAPALGIATLALITASSLRALRAVGAPWFDAWMLAAALPLVGAALLVRRRRADAAAWMPTTLVVTALGVVVALSGVRVAAVPGETLRVVLTLVAVLVLGVIWRGAHERIVFWAAVGLAAVFSVAALLAGAADPVEAVTVPVAGALLFSGARALRTRHDLRTWPALGVGLALLLVPSLLFDFSDDNALWRVIALGIVALAALLVGVRYRLQAPVLLGGIVLIVHAIAQLWPWITSLYESASGLWWLWLGIAGVVLIVVAATYERRIREVKAVALAIRSLR